jgi:hypothetical protein
MAILSFTNVAKNELNNMLNIAIEEENYGRAKEIADAIEIMV